MSSIVIAGDTSGSVTLQAPAVAGSTVLNLPATSGTIQTSGAGYTTNGVAYATSTSALTTGSALTFDGTNTFKVIPSTGLAYSRTESSQYSTWMQMGAGNANVFWEFSANTPVRWVDTSSGELMRLTSTGLGIGTSSPAAKLHVKGTGTSGQVTSSFILENGSSGTMGMDITGAAGSSYLRMLYGGGPSTGTNTLSLGMSMVLEGASAGNVGIGTSSPSQKLDVTVSSSTEGSGLAVTNSLTGGYGSGVTFYSLRSDTSAKLAAGSIVMNGAAAWNSNASTSSNMIFSTVGANTLAERARIDSSGNLLVGTTSTAQSSSNGVKVRNYGAVFVVNDGSTGGGDGFSYYQTSASAYRFYVASNGTISATNTSISAISDIRFKENVRDLDVGLAEVMTLKPRLYDWKEGKGANIKNARGFIAQEFEEVFPDLIDEWKDPAPEGEEPYKSVRQDLIPVLVKAIQEQQALITSLTERISVLENK